MRTHLTRLLLLAAVSFTTITVASAQPPAEPQPNLEAMHPSHRNLYFVMRRGTEWLVQAQQPNGLFHQGANVAVNTPLEAAHYYHQTEAAIALARVSRLTMNQRYQAAALQASLTLLASTKPDTQQADVRYTYLPETTVNRLGSAGLLLRAVHELPMPAEVRLKEAEGLAQYVRVNQQADGSFQATSGVVQTTADSSQESQQRMYEGLALEGLAISQTYSPAPWKTEAIQKVARQIAEQKMPVTMVAMPCYVGSLAETYFRSKDQACAVAVFNMADALCNAQKQAEPGRVAWTGGFVFHSGKNLVVPPQASDSARCVSALCDAYRVAKQAGDAARADKYRNTASLGVQFIASLQYTGNGVEHFAESYQPRILGSFRASPGEGVIRLQDGAECVLAVSTFLSDVCGVSLAPVAK